MKETDFPEATEFYIKEFDVPLAYIPGEGWFNFFGGKSPESHLIESQNALNEFQEDADKYFNGSLKKLITHYEKNDDQVFNAGGNSIQSLHDRNLLLKKNFTEF